MNVRDLKEILDKYNDYYMVQPNGENIRTLWIGPFKAWESPWIATPKSDSRNYTNGDYDNWVIK